jgi:hypothetical protein
LIQKAHKKSPGYLFLAELLLIKITARTLKGFSTSAIQKNHPKKIQPAQKEEV